MNTQFQLVLAVILAATFGCRTACCQSSNEATASDSEAKVGMRGTLSKIVFAGQNVIDERKLRSALSDNMDFLIASQPETNLAACLRTLETSLRAGYQHAGFPDAEVRAKADADSGKIVVAIIEGPRLFCGDVRVTGVTSPFKEAVARRIYFRIAPESVVKRLPDPLGAASETTAATRESLPGDSAGTMSILEITNRSGNSDMRLGIWETGKPVPLDPAARASFAEAITNAFADLGHFLPAFQFDFYNRPMTNEDLVRTNAGAETADLVVNVLAEGPVCTIGSIEVEGLEKNSDDDLVRWTGLAIGQQLTREVLLVAEHKLWNSGRFTVATLTPGQPDADGRVNLVVKVRELAAASPLTSECSPSEAAMLRLRTWLVEWSKRQEDLVFRLEAEVTRTTNRLSTEFIVSPLGRVFSSFTRPADTDGRAAASWAFAAARGRTGLFDGTQRQSLVTSNSNVTIMIYFNTVLSPEGEGNLTLGAGFDNNSTNEPFSAAFNLMPAAFVKLASETNYNWRFQSNFWIYADNEKAVRVDDKSGRLVECSISFPGSTNSLLSLGAGVAFLSFESNALAQAESAFMKAHGPFTNRYDPIQPWASSLAFLVEAGLRSPLATRHGLSKLSPDIISKASLALRTLFNADTFAPLERLTDDNDESPDDVKFVIPPPTDDDSADTANWLNKTAAWVLSQVGEILPAESWPAELMRAYTLGLTGRERQFELTWTRLSESNDIGPLGCLILSRCAGQTGQRFFATKGLARLSRDQFTEDCRLFLDGDTILPVCLRNLLGSAREWSDEDIEAVAAMLPEKEADSLRLIVHELRKTKGSVDFATITPALIAWWDKSLRAQLSTTLRGLVAARSPDGADKNR